VPRVLVVDDEEPLRVLVTSTLRFAGYDVVEAADGTEALGHVAGVDLVVLDIGMPGLDGFELVRLLRSRGTTTPVLFLTARDDVDDRVRGLRLGADDYVTKPFSVAEVVARVEALLRRTGADGGEPEDDETVRLADLVLDRAAMAVTRGDRPVQLSPTEFRLLEYLLVNQGRVLSKSQILQHVWGYDFGGDANVVERFVSNLRRKIDDGAATPLLRTVRGFGYTARVEP
jgi:two-component system, OmpR family, response regulator